MLAFIWAAAPLGAMTNEEFLTFLAGESGPADAAAMKAALDSGVDVNYRGPGGVTPLMVYVSARRDGDWQAVAALRVLLKGGAEINALNDQGASALSYAVLHRAGPRLVSTLLQHGADVNLGVSAGGGVTPLMIAASGDPDPVLSALLLAAGARTEVAAQREGKSVTLQEIAQQNPNPRVRRFIEAMVKRGGGREAGPPLFADPPDDPALKTRLREMDQEIRALIGPDNWLDWLDYVRWQIEIAGNIELRRSHFHNSFSEAWLNEYRFYLEGLAESGERGAFSDPDRARLVIQGPWLRKAGQDLEMAALLDRRIIIARAAGQGTLAAYETDGGRELWRYTPAALGDFYLIRSTPPAPEALVGPPRPAAAQPAPRPEDRPAGGGSRPGRGPDYPLILAASDWGEQFGDAALLDPVSGAVLLELPPLDAPRWTVDEGRRVLALSTDYSLNLFDLAQLKNGRHSWYGFLENHPWEEARLAARDEQNRLLADYGLSLDAQGQFVKNNSQLFRRAAEPDPALLRQALAALKQYNYDQLAVMALDARNLNDRNFILGPDCVGGCQAVDLDTPLFLVNQSKNRIDTLMVDNDPGRVLTRRALGWTEGPSGRLTPLIHFSPGGAVAAVAEAGGDVHLFSAREQGRFLGTVPGATVLEEAGRIRVKDSRLLALLDDDESGRPFLAFELPGREGPPVLAVEIELNGAGLGRRFHPAPAAGPGLTAFSVAGDGQWAAATADGGLWHLEADGETLRRIEPEGGRDWRALAFSGDGRRLAAAERGGGLYLFEAGRLARRLALDLKNITHLALDQEGLWAWVAAENYGQAPAAPPALALVDLSGQSKPVYRRGPGRILSLSFKAEAGYAVAVEDQGPGARDPRGPGPLKPLKSLDVSRWRQGRTDIVKFDHLRRVSGREDRGRYDPETVFAGLSPNLDLVYYQELRPARAFVQAGRESVSLRQGEALKAFTYQARLGPAVFSGDGRLALLPEDRPAEEGAAAWPYQASGAFYVYDQDSGREVAYMSDRSRHPAGIVGASFLKDPARLLTAGRDGSVRLWDLKGGRPVNLLSWIFLENGHWAVLDAEGRYDSPQPGLLPGLHWAVDGPGRLTLPLEALIYEFYQPRLAAGFRAGRKVPPLTPPAERDLFQPELKISRIEPEKEAAGRVAVTVEINGRDGRGLHPVRDLKLFRDGRMLARHQGGGPVELDGDGRAGVIFRNLALPLSRERVQFSATALNGDGVRSNPARAAIRYQKAGEAAPRLHLSAFGIGTFDNPAWNIDYAADDAQAYPRILPRYFLGGRVEGRILSGLGGRPRATLANLRATLNSLSPLRPEGETRFSGSGPDDVVFLAVSSRAFEHEGRFHFLAADAPGRERALSPELLARSVSSRELYDWLSPLDAEEIILVLDAYQPELEPPRPDFERELERRAPPLFQAGPLGDRTLALMAYDKALRIFCVVGRAGEALAYGQGGLGVPAYALLVDGLENGGAAAEGQAFSFQHWLRFGQARALELRQSLREASGRPADNDSYAPQPGLLDFGGPSRPHLGRPATAE
jgi:hypothetical protein